MKRNRTNAAMMIDTLEARTLYSGSFQTVGYLPDYRVGTNVKWDALTQINYFAVNPNAAGQMPGAATDLTPAQALQFGHGDSTAGYDLSQLAGVVQQAHSHGVKVDVVIGGADDGSEPLTHIIDNPNLQNAFSKSVARFIRNYGIDGIDLDWEPNTITTQEVRSYDNLISTVRDGMHREFDLSAAVNAEKVDMATPHMHNGVVSRDSNGDVIKDLTYDKKGNPLTQYILDRQAAAKLTSINVMAYDLTEADACSIWRTEDDMAGWAKELKADHVSANKLVFGVPFYAHDAGGVQEPITYGQLVSDNGGVTPTADSMIDGTTWLFDNPDSIDAKTQFAISQSYRGMACWELGQDNFGVNNDQPGQLLSQIQSTVLTYTNTISGTVFNDINHNGIKDAGEIGIAGYSVYIDMATPGTITDKNINTQVIAITDANGAFKFKNLINGTYRIERSRENAFGWNHTTAPYDIVTVGYGDHATGALFGESRF